MIEEPPSVYNTLDKWIVKYVEANPNVVTSEVVRNPVGRKRQILFHELAGLSRQRFTW